MSYNVRWANPNDGDDVWDNRKETVAAIINAQQPHILGLQVRQAGACWLGRRK